MPEILTKYPKIVKQILNDTGVVQCGKKKQKNILKKCPDEWFCSFPTGELCIYNYKDINKMTQLKRNDLVKHCSLCGKKGHYKNNKKYH